MSHAWDWLKDEKNRAVITMVGAGLSSVAAVYIYFFPAPDAKPSPPTTHVEQKGTGFAAGHDNVINAPVTFNNPDAKEVTAPIVEQIKELTAAQKELAAQTARQKGVEIAPLRAILVKMGEAGVKDEEIPKLLDAKADELVKLRAEVDVLQHGSPAVAALAKEAEALINKGDLDGASSVLARGREAARAQRINANRDEATVLALDAQVDDLKLAYRSAAAKYGEAAGLVAGFDPDKQFQLLDQQENELYKQGDEFGDNPALIEAIEVARGMQAAARDANQRRTALNWLGIALQSLGERESGTARLEEAVMAYRAALEEITRERAPLQWATTQMNLGNALLRLGERESGTARLEEAVAAYRAAIEECTRERAPLDWATTLNNLGAALKALGERESGTARLEEAVAVYRAALEERTRRRVPLQWATTQNNLGAALSTLGGRESGTARLEEAVAAYRAALEERTRVRVPLDWATTQNNLGVALSMLGGRESGTARLEEAVAAYRAALEERTRVRVPLQWARAQNNLGAALQNLGVRESGTARLEEAVTAYRAALEEWTRARVPPDWAMTQNNLGNALQSLGERESGTARLEEAVAAYRAALEEWTRARVPLQWATATGNQGVALMILAERRRDLHLARQALDQIETAFAVCRDGGHAVNAAYYEERLPGARALVDRLSKDTQKKASKKHH
jgi:tetratricopeptide (TPR) repeat protein